MDQPVEAGYPPPVDQEPPLITRKGLRRAVLWAALVVLGALFVAASASLWLFGDPCMRGAIFGGALTACGESDSNQSEARKRLMVKRRDLVAGGLAWIEGSPAEEVVLYLEDARSFEPLSDEFLAWADQQGKLLVVLDDCEISDEVLQDWLLRMPATHFTIDDRRGNPERALAIQGLLERIEAGEGRAEALPAMAFNYAGREQRITQLLGEERR